MNCRKENAAELTVCECGFPLKLDLTHYREPIKDPAISTVLDVIGWVSLIIGVLIAIFGGASEGPALVGVGLTISISGIAFLALAAIIDRLHRIEIHLRPGAQYREPGQQQPAGVTLNPASK